MEESLNNKLKKKRKSWKVGTKNTNPIVVHMTSHHVTHSMKIRMSIFIHPIMSNVMIDMLYKVLRFKRINQACLVYQDIHYDTSVMYGKTFA
jgi:hypothetical protein